MSDPVRERAVRIHVDVDAVRHNLALAKRLSGAAKAFAVVKADAYGHGAVALARALDAADGFAVVGLGEAEALRAGGVTRPVLVMQGPHSADVAHRFAELDLWPAVHRPEQHGWLAGAATGRADAPAAVAQGRHRHGPARGDAGRGPGAARRARASPGCGVMSHFASADAPGSAQTREQIRRFDALAVPAGLDRSLANSAASLAWPGTGHDWIRPGLMLYGANPLDGVDPPDGVELAPAMTVSAPLISVKVLPRGHRVGYSGTWECPEDMPVGHAAIGYADGLPRVLDAAEGSADARGRLGGGAALPARRTGVDGLDRDRPARRARRADRRRGHGCGGPGQPVERLARAAGTIPYELLTGHPRRAPLERRGLIPCGASRSGSARRASIRRRVRGFTPASNRGGTTSSTSRVPDRASVAARDPVRRRWARNVRGGPVPSPVPVPDRHPRVTSAFEILQLVLDLLPLVRVRPAAPSGP